MVLVGEALVCVLGTGTVHSGQQAMLEEEAPTIFTFKRSSLLGFLLCHLPDLLLILVHFKSSQGHAASAGGRSGKGAVLLSTPEAEELPLGRVLGVEMTPE